MKHVILSQGNMEVSHVFILLNKVQKYANVRIMRKTTVYNTHDSFVWLVSFHDLTVEKSSFIYIDVRKTSKNTTSTNYFLWSLIVHCHPIAGYIFLVHHHVA